MSRARELALVLAGGFLLTIALTWPLAANLGRVGRVDQADGQFSIWNVAWVARTLVVDPVHVYDANIFYPHRATLAYSENNIGTGALAVPAYWLGGRNPYLAHNFVVLLAFVLSGAGMYYLVRHLLGRAGDAATNRAAICGGAAVAAIAFAFGPYVFARTAHIQLMMTAGVPFAMLALHRLVERPGVGRGAVLGAVMAAQAACCGYYGVFLILMVGLAVVVLATLRREWGSRALWSALAAGAVIAVAIVGPLFLPYVRLQRVEGFGRPLGDAIRYSADWRAYLASSSYAHAWMLPLLTRWNEVLFPGFVAIALGLSGLAVCWRSRRDVFWLYGALTLLAFWASFGPGAGLYSLLYRVVPFFTWLRAPARFGLLVVFGLAVLAGHGAAALLARSRRPSLVGVVLAAATAAELAVPLNLPRAEALSPAYRMLASSPTGPLIEMPFYYPEVGLFQHTKYMLASTSHWMPLVNGYSDYIPPDFLEHVHMLAPFPSRDAFRILEPNRVRYAMFHMYGYNDINRAEVVERLKQFEPYLRPLYIDEQTRLYEIVSYPK